MNDLDRIISNLEAQQKNLATFGAPGQVPSKTVQNGQQ
jgi:hypothetical protein